jgi:hypothetical protein
MATTARRWTALSNEELGRLLSLLQGADSVELKLTVPDGHQRSAVTALGMDPIRAQIRQVFFFDTPELTLDRAGVVVRARRIQGKGGDSVVKLRPVVPDQLPASLRSSPNLVVEVDAMPGGTYVCSAALKRAGGIDDAREVAHGSRPIRKLFSKQQRAFFAEHAPEGVGLDELSVLGPITLLKLKAAVAGYDRRAADQDQDRSAVFLQAARRRRAGVGLDKSQPANRRIWTVSRCPHPPELSNRLIRNTTMLVPRAGRTSMIETAK